jgi:hypothetical protein
VTPETVAINAGRGGNDAAGRSVPPQGPTQTSPSSRPAAWATSIPSPRSSKMGLPAATTPSLIRKPHPQETAYAPDHHGPDLTSDPAVRMLTDRSFAIAAIRIADLAAPDPCPHSPPQAAYPEPCRRAQPDRPPPIAPVSTSRQMTNGQEPAARTPGCEATKP